MSTSTRDFPGKESRPNLGWTLGGLVVLGVFVVGAALWFSYHP